MRRILIAVAVFGAGAYGQNNCDRVCLEGLVDQHLRVAVAHNATHLPLLKGVKYTENGQHLEINDGLWNTMSAPGTYQL